MRRVGTPIPTEYATLVVQRLGAMLAPITFLLANGHQVSPMQVAPWAHEPGAQELPGVLRRLRGDWSCFPFGYSVPSEGFAPDWALLLHPAEPGEEAHGHGSNSYWSWSGATATPASEPLSVTMR